MRKKGSRRAATGDEEHLLLNIVNKYMKRDPWEYCEETDILLPMHRDKESFVDTMPGMTEPERVA